MSASRRGLADVNRTDGYNRGVTDSPPDGLERLAGDTSPEAEARQLEAWRRRSSVEIAQTIRAAWLAGRRMAWIGLRERFPLANEDELRARLAVQLLGADLARRVHPDIDRYLDA